MSCIGRWVFNTSAPWKALVPLIYYFYYIFAFTGEIFSFIIFIFLVIIFLFCLNSFNISCETGLVVMNHNVDKLLLAWETLSLNSDLWFCWLQYSWSSFLLSMLWLYHATPFCKVFAEMSADSVVELPCTQLVVFL